METHLLLALRAGAGADHVARDVLNSSPAAGVATLCPASALPALAHAAGLSPELPDLLVTVDSADAAAKVWRAVSKDANSSRSTVVVAQRHDVLPGNDAIRLFFGLRRLERLTRAQFQDYWLNHHADYGRRLIPPYTYHQLHTDGAATAAASKALGIPESTLDGIVEVHFPSLEALIKQLSRPDVAEGALADEKNFIDHARSVFWAYRTLA